MCCKPNIVMFLGQRPSSFWSHYRSWYRLNYNTVSCNSIHKRLAVSCKMSHVAELCVLRLYIFSRLCVIGFYNFSLFASSHRFEFLSCQYAVFLSNLMPLYGKFSGQRSRETNLSAVGLEEVSNLLLNTRSYCLCTDHYCMVKGIATI